MEELDSAKIKEFYDRDPQREWDRHDRYPFEFPITCLHIGKHLSRSRSRILDIGGGPGRYAFHFARLGHRVSLVDLSDGNINFARRMSNSLNVELEDCRVGNALDLSNYPSNAFDLVLNLGPLYHISDPADRARCISETLRVLQPGGIAFFAFISCYAPIYDTLKKLPEREILSIERLRELFGDQKLIHSKNDPGFTDAQFVDPSRVADWMSSLGINVISTFGAESLLPQSQYHIDKLAANKIEEWIQFGFELSETPGGIIGSEHIVVVARK